MMLWQIIGIVSLGWGGFVFYMLSKTALPPGVENSIQPGIDIAIINILALGWLVSSSLVKINLILKKRWIRVCIVSCIFFIFLLINMAFMQTGAQSQLPSNATEFMYLYNLTASWFISWFWIDILFLVKSLTSRTGAKTAI